MFFEWNTRTYGLNVPEMDKEHEILIQQMNRLHELHQQRAPRAQVAAALDALQEFTVRHFAGEEEYMARIGYAELPRHARVHHELLSNLRAHVQKFRTAGALDEEFFSFLTFWLKAHIRGVDVRYTRKPVAA